MVSHVPGNLAVLPTKAMGATVDVVDISMPRELIDRAREQGRVEGIAKIVSRLLAPLFVE